MQSHRDFLFYPNYNFGQDTIFGTGAIFPVLNNFFLLMDGTDFLLMDGTNFDLMGT